MALLSPAHTRSPLLPHRARQSSLNPVPRFPLPPPPLPAGHPPLAGTAGWERRRSAGPSRVCRSHRAEEAARCFLPSCGAGSGAGRLGTRLREGTMTPRRSGPAASSARAAPRGGKVGSEQGPLWWSVPAGGLAEGPPGWSWARAGADSPPVCPPVRGWAARDCRPGLQLSLLPHRRQCSCSAASPGPGGGFAPALPRPVTRVSCPEQGRDVPGLGGQGGADRAVDPRPVLPGARPEQTPALLRNTGTCTRPEIQSFIRDYLFVLFLTV